MLGVLAPLAFFLGLIGVSEAQYQSCDYYTTIEPGKNYYITNPNDRYPGGFRCRWNFRSENTIKMNCTIDIPPTNGCSQDALAVKSDSDPPHNYCGNGVITFASDENNQILVTMNSKINSRGGRFYCLITAEAESCQCGWQNPSRIVGGKETGVNEYPMVAGIVHLGRVEIICGATIINSRQVVTAAHCLSGQQLSNFGIIIGEHNTNTGSETSATQLFNISNYAPHPNYDSRTELNDIAVVTINGNMKFSQLVGPACLPFQHSRDSFAGDYVYLLGWGTTGFAAAPSSVLQSTQVSVITKKDCMNSFAMIQDSQMCTFAKNRDSCQMDSGGPVLWKNPSTKRLVLVGIISSGTDCGGSTPGINTRVGQFMDFILSQTLRGYQYCDAE